MILLIILLLLYNITYSYKLSYNRHYSYYKQRYYLSLNSNNNDNDKNNDDNKYNNLSDYIDIDEMISLFDDDILTSKIRSKPIPISGNDIEIDIEVPFNTATFGGKEQIKIKRNIECNTCNGSGFNQDDEDEFCSKCRGKRTNLVIKEVLIEIPPGISENSLIKINGFGNSGVNGGENGNLLVTIKSIKCHPKFKKRGTTLDIISEEEIFYYDAILGIKKEVETIHGLMLIEIPKGFQHGEEIKIKDYGIRIPESKGDAYIIVKVKIPTEISPKEKELIDQLDRLQRDSN